ncbi:hypothetical protein [Haloimpatiens lingqiaonensis]|uniref:hypothetical protein n=1 Tax=Haloimpatiens lingqiaonensis TaxID=1380675 RepID=UPI0010FEE154|nr:hypothetical protein [Haloimpatiens lingqiaonensis]
MICVINLSMPRKGIQKFYNNCMFKIKCKNIHLNKGLKIASITSMGMIFISGTSYASSIAGKSNCIGNHGILECVGYPGVDFAFQIFKMRKDLYNYMVYKIKKN